MADCTHTTPAPAGESSAANKANAGEAAHAVQRNRGTQILRLYHELEALYAAAFTYCEANIDDPDLDEKAEQLFYERTDALEDEVMALPSTCAADLAATMLLMHRDGEGSLIHRSHPGWVEARVLVNTAAETEVARLYPLWQTAAELADHEVCGEITASTAYAAYRAVEDELLAAPAVSLRDLAIKIVVVEEAGGEIANGGDGGRALVAEARQIVGGHAKRRASTLVLGEDEDAVSVEAADGMSALADLPFVATKGPRPCFWHVTSTGDSSEDGRLGREYALRYLDFEEADRGGGGNLQLIVGDMPRDLGPIEIGFLVLVSYAAGAGRAEAHRVDGYWRSCAARRST